MNLGETIREQRKRKGLSQEQLAERTSLSRQTIYKWESGQAMPDLENLKLLAGALDTTVSDLLGEAPAPAPAAPGEDLLQKSARLAKKHWRKGGYVLLCYGAGAVVFGLLGRAMFSAFFRAPAGFPALPGGVGVFGGMEKVMLLVPTVFLIGGLAVMAVGGYLAWKDWKLNRKK